MTEPWPFEDPRNVATITTRHVIRDGLPILLVTHDADDGCWQFLPGCDVVPADGLIVGLGCMVARDASLAELADLPLGWRATRDRVGAPWTRTRSET
jgi:hypothetical protein